MANLLSYQLSYWEREVFFKHLDVVVIGSGIVGLSAAIHLKENAPELNVVVLERGPLPIGASTRNAGFACFGSMTELIADLETQSESAVFDLVARRWAGLNRLRERLGDSAISFQNNGGYELFRPSEESTFSTCLDHLAHFNKILQPIIGNEQVFSVKDELISTFGFGEVKHLIFNQAEGQIHTGKMMQALLQLAYRKGIRIYNGVGVEAVEEHSNEVRLQSQQGWIISASKVLVATNGFARQLFPKQAIQPARNQVLITKKVPLLPFKGCFHYDAGYYYFRNIDDRILFGGGRNLTPKQETTTEFGTTEMIRNRLTDLLRTVILPGQAVEVDHWWSGILGVGDQNSPIIHKVSNRIAIAIRLGGMGVAIGSLVGEEGAELLL